MQASPLEADLAAASWDLELLVRRLRSLSSRARQDRVGAARAALDGLVALDARLEDRRLVAPRVADHILADAIAVVGGDVMELISIRADRDHLMELRVLIDAALVATR